jgi:hypothetical protein
MRVQATFRRLRAAGRRPYDRRMSGRWIALSAVALLACGAGSSSTGDGGFVCAPACGAGLACCAGGCVNPRNDILNCGNCGVVCPGPAPFCNSGVCAQAPCNAGVVCGGALCCGGACCAAGELCCEVMTAGPSRGPACTAPVGGTCPVGCPTCR